MQNSEITNLDAARQFGLGVLLGVWAAIDHGDETDPFTRRAVTAGLAARNAGDPDAGLRFAVRHYRRHGSRKPRGTLSRRAEHLARFLTNEDAGRRGQIQGNSEAGE